MGATKHRDHAHPAEAPAHGARSIVLGLSALLAPSVALAQPGAAPVSAPAPTAAPARVAAVPAMAVAPPGQAPLEDREANAAPAPPAGIGARVAADAAAGRAYLADTALTSPRGKVLLQLRMPLAPGADAELRYSITDRIEVGVSGLAIADEDEAVVGFHAKGQIWHNHRAAIAVGLRRYQSTGRDDEAVTVPGVVASTCLDGNECLALFSLSLNAVVISDETDVPVFAGASWALGKKVQFVGEIHVSNDADRSSSLTLGYLGLRAASGSFTVDAGLGFGSEDDADCWDCSSDSEAFPFIGVATRM